MIASFSQALLSSSSSSNNHHRNLLLLQVVYSSSNLKQSATRWRRKHHNINLLRVRASNSQEAKEDEEEDCNEEECAPDKEVGKVSMEWLAGDKTRVTGTFPPKKRGWTGYVEKDTAGQTNIYPIEPAIYIAESAISSGSAGSSSEGAENTAAVAAGFALISIALASSILLQLGKKTTDIQQPLEQQYSGPSLTYYITKFKPQPPQLQILQAPQPELSTPPSPQLSTPPPPPPPPPQIQLEDDASSTFTTLP